MEMAAMASRSSAHTLCRLLASVLVTLMTLAAIPAFADPMSDYIAAMTANCKKLTQEKERLTRLAYQKGPQATEDTAVRMAKVSENVAKAQKMLAEKPPQTPAEQQAFLETLNNLISSSNMEIRGAQRQLGLKELGALDINAEDFMGRITKGFDGSGFNSNATPVEVDIPRQPGTNFFQTNPCKADVNKRADAGKVQLSKCPACTGSEIQQHLAELEHYRQAALAACDSAQSR
jgi:hypothetical protein